MKRISLLFVFFIWLVPVGYAKGKILATPGVSTFEGSAGGGLVPWAQLAGYDSEDEYSTTGFCTRAGLKDFDLSVCGVQLGLYDRIEMSAAKQSLGVQPLGLAIEQDIWGIKTRLYGDIIYSKWPQVSFGVQHKRLQDRAVAASLGVSQFSANDYYISASKLHLAAASGYHLFWNLTLRRTAAIETGFLGFSSDAQWQPEVSAAAFLNHEFAIGMEYRTKPDELAIGESHWRDLFIAWFPNKQVNVTFAYLDFKQVAAIPQQNGWYLSLSGSF
ncbi:MAG: DUF3034 family protein [Gammaproteobacteria bacterium]|nr:DUF3034 family protein [Gammaproteobacteria bacterium]NVK88349.1 DUF3034 family protein [Gammaproteobacteria bacterium]